MSILLVRTVSAIGPIQRGFHKFLQSYDQYRSLREFVAEIGRAAEVSIGERPPRFEHAITLEEVSFAYGQRPVLDRLSLTIPYGLITTLAGRSGVGKSTTVDLIVGLYRPNAGRVLVDGVDLQELDLSAWRNLIGYVPQEVTLFHTSVLNNVSLWAEGFGEEEVVEALKAAGAWSFVQQLEGGLQHVVGERGQRLSGGQRQRISIARALLHRPRLLILDEATTGLDQRTEAEICAAIQRLSREQGLTVLAISHQPAWQEVADRVYFLQDGRVAELSERAPDAGVDAAVVG
jgi:ATP-binding cassette subfamily C protein